jgi:predicted HicB family RNase H-like nuclease
VKSARFELRIDPRLKEEAEKAAAEDERSLADLVAKLLREYLAKNKRGRA